MRKIAMMVGALVLGTAVVAQAATPLELVDARKANFKKIGGAMKASGDTFKSGAPDAAVLKANAAIIAGFADQVPSWFPAGTAVGVGKSEAKPNIWTDKAGFAKAAADFSAAAKGYKAAADTGNLAAAGAALGKLGGTCKGCHETFRQKD
jgi:cytochrome c556